MRIPRSLLVLSVLAFLFELSFGEGLSQTPLFQVKVNGKLLALHEFEQGSFGQFAYEGPTEVEIRTGFNTRWVDVRPLSSRVRASVDGDHATVRFQLEKAQDLTVEFNCDIAKVLHLFAVEPEAKARRRGEKGLIYFGPGVHEVGLIELKDGETLYLAEGAWVRGCVRAVGVRTIAIEGRGVLDGSGLEALRLAARTKDSSREPAYAGWNHNVIYFNGVEHARIEGVTLFDSRAWTVYLRACRGVQVEGVRILNPSNRYGNDGIDVVSSSQVQIRRCFIRTNDDCIVVKNLEDLPMRDIVVENCVLWNMPLGGNGLEIGFEMRGAPASDIVFRAIDLIHVQRGAALSIHNGDHATVERVLFEDIRVEDVRRKVIDFCVLYAQYGLDRPPTLEEREGRMDRGGVWDGEQRLSLEERKERAGQRGRVRGVTVRNLQVVDGTLPYSIIAGYDEAHPVEDVLIEGFSYRGQALRTREEARLVVHNAKHIELH